MPRSTEQPDIIQLRRTHIEDDGYKLDLLVHWDIQQIQVEDIDDTFHTEYDYSEESIRVTYEGTKDDLTTWLVDNQQQLVLKAKAKWEKRGNTIDNEDKAELQDIKNSTVYAQISDIDATKPNKKYIQVKRTISGKTFTRWCYASYSVLLCYQNNDLAIDDYVILDFIDGNMNKSIVLDKVIL